MNRMRIHSQVRIFIFKNSLGGFYLGSPTKVILKLMVSGIRLKEGLKVRSPLKNYVNFGEKLKDNS